jgi:hypothetical protein
MWTGAGGGREWRRRAHGRWLVSVRRELVIERRQRAAVERGGEGGAPGVGDRGVVEVEPPELLQPSTLQSAAAVRRLSYLILMCFTPTRRHHRQKPTFTFKRTVYDA